jgi:hypothetical protein
VAAIGSALQKLGAGERIRTVDLRITSAPSGNLTQTSESPESQNPNKSETLRPKRIIKTLDGGECAPRVAQKWGRPQSQTGLDFH